MPVWLLLRRWRRVPFDCLVCSALGLAGLVSGLLYAFSQQMRAVVRRVAASQPTMLRFGAPPDVVPWFVLALVAALLAAALVGALGYVLWRRRGPVIARLALAVAVLPALIFVALLLLWGWVPVWL
jgi:hypothetical protein